MLPYIRMLVLVSVMRSPSGYNRVKIRARLQLRSYTSTRFNKKLDKVLISLLRKTKTKKKFIFEKIFVSYRYVTKIGIYRVTILSLLFQKCTVIGTDSTFLAKYWYRYRRYFYSTECPALLVVGSKIPSSSLRCFELPCSWFKSTL